MLGGIFLAMLDQNIVGTALPRLTADIGGGQLYTWVVGAYLLTSTVTLPLYGRLSDLYGARKFMVVSLLVFLGGSILCGLARNMGTLILFRAVQGLGAGGLLPISLALIAGMFRSGRAGRLSALIGITMSSSYAIGPVLGGVLADYASWRWIFFINIPLCAIVLAAVVIAVHQHPHTDDGGHPDYVGIGVFTVGVTALLFGITERGLDSAGGASHGWTSPLVGFPILAGLLVLLVFVIIEARARNPIVPISFFRHRTYLTINAVSFFSAASLYVSIVFLPRYFQDVKGFDATMSGLMIYPILLGLVVSNTAIGAMIGRNRRYKNILVAALVSMLAGCTLVVWVSTTTSWWYLAFAMLLIGFGFGPVLAGLTVVIQDVVAPAHTGMASSALTFFRQIGGLIALTAAGTIYSDRLAGSVGPSDVDAVNAGSVAIVLPALGGAGAIVSLIAFVMLPEWPLWSDETERMEFRRVQRDDRESPSVRR
jgi:EmrB/QacA subfamily drug resistance transporter